MSFAPQFNARWDTVIRPGLEAIIVDGQPLEPFRVDLSRASDAILTEVLRSIADCRIIFADITSTAELDGLAVRNSNVMYEVGLAHASRVPEEVVLFRSHTHKLDFDVQGVRVHQYAPDEDSGGARKSVTEVVSDSLRALESRQRTSVRLACERLSLPAMWLLFEALNQDHIPHPPGRTPRDVLGNLGRNQAISTLLAVGAIRSKPLKITKDLLRQPNSEVSLLDYEITRFAT